MTFVYFKGATAYELQIGRVWFHLRFFKYWKYIGPGFIRITKKETSSKE